MVIFTLCDIIIRSLKILNINNTMPPSNVSWLSLVLPIGGELDCLTKDQIINLSSNSVQAKDYRLVVKISGSHDKVVLISLYPKNVTFDGCGRTNQQRRNSRRKKTN